MNDFYTEHLIKQKPTAKTMAIKAALIALCVVSALAMFVIPFGYFITVIVIFVVVTIFKRFDLEFEYLYINGDLDIDKIMNMQSRKKQFSTNIKEMEIIAPSGSAELHPYQRLKTLDYSTLNPEDKVYEMVTSFKGETVRVLFNPNEKILNEMKNMAPRKVFF